MLRPMLAAMSVLAVVGTLTACTDSTGGTLATPCSTGQGKSVSVAFDRMQPGVAVVKNNSLDGFDVAMACQIIKRIYGPDAHLAYHKHTGMPTDEISTGATFVMSSNDPSENVLTSKPYYSHSIAIVAPVSQGIAQPRDLSGKTVCDATDSLNDEWFSGEGVTPPPKRTSVASAGSPDPIADCLKQLTSGTANAVAAFDPELSGELAADNPGKYREVALPHYIDNGQSVASAPTDTGFAAKVQGALNQIHDDGTWQKLVAKYWQPGGYNRPYPPG